MLDELNMVSRRSAQPGIRGWSLSRVRGASTQVGAECQTLNVVRKGLHTSVQAEVLELQWGQEIICMEQGLITKTGD